MNLKALDIFLGQRHIGILLHYAIAPDQVVHRFVADDDFARDPAQPTLSLAFRASDPGAQAAFWAAVGAPVLNGARARDARRSWLLPAFFQNLLPEGPLRDRIAELRGCHPDDHFELLAATGKDLPGDVTALPATLTRAQQSRLITQDQDALDMSVVAAPLDGAISLSGVQAKLAAIREGSRYVARTTTANAGAVRHVIAKLPVAGTPLLPELEDLSLRLARAAGVSAVEAELAPLATLAIEHGYDLGAVDARTRFLAVSRYDRDAATPTGRVHAEDFAQVLGMQPEAKYQGDYLTIAAVMMAAPTLGEPAVHELLRRILVNELLGNPDMPLKNIGLLYPDGQHPILPPAYDIVGYAALGTKPQGRALRLLPAPPAGQTERVDPRAPLGPALVREFCARLGLPEKPAWTALRRCAARARESWPALIAAADITDTMKARLLERLAQRVPSR